MDNNIHLGSKIRKYRHLAGMTQEELAEYSNLSVNYISKIEREKNKTSVLKNSSTSATPLTFPLKKYLIVNITFQCKNLPPNAIELITYLRDSDGSNIDEICEQLLLMKEMEK